VGLGGNLRRKHPLGFFLWGMVLSSAVIGTGVALLDEPTTTQPRAAIGGILDGSGLLLAAMVLLLGIVDLSRYLLRLSRGNRPAKQKSRSQTQSGNLRPPTPGPQQQRTQQQQRPQQHSGDCPLTESTVKILVVGYAGSGKTLMLASLYHCFAHGTPAGIRFTTDDESNRTLVDYATSIRDPRRPPLP
jgi:hypothetical protein